MTVSPKPKATKKSNKKVDPAVLKQRREAIEKRIEKLESKLNKDRLLLSQYADQAPAE